MHVTDPEFMCLYWLPDTIPFFFFFFFFKTPNTFFKTLFSHVEMTGDYTPDLVALLSADIIISTPEKWDGISRNWHTRSYVKKVHLFVNRLLYRIYLFRE